ncbi:hypothetical protein ACJRO7_029933 [Eucalyptus globulus]|uniref:Transmembrane protein n=1 Tax=Eucalyptus globulus TaxID=34317 RepID=A0ABD3JD08_EUCGL
MFQPRLFPFRSTGNYNAGAAVSIPRNHHKRSRDAVGDDHLSGDHFLGNHNPRKISKASPFLGHEAAFEIPGHQSEIDPFFLLPFSIIFIFCVVLVSYALPSL